MSSLLEAVLRERWPTASEVEAEKRLPVPECGGLNEEFERLLEQARRVQS